MRRGQVNTQISSRTGPDLLRMRQTLMNSDEPSGGFTSGEDPGEIRLRLA